MDFIYFITEYPTIDIYCCREVENFDNEADQIQIIAFSTIIDFGCIINAVSADAKYEKLCFPADHRAYIIDLLFTPGHYDALYHEKVGTTP